MDFNLIVSRYKKFLRRTYSIYRLWWQIENYDVVSRKLYLVQYKTQSGIFNLVIILLSFWWILIVQFLHWLFSKPEKKVILARETLIFNEDGRATILSEKNWYLADKYNKKYGFLV